MVLHLNSIILDAPFVESQGFGLKNWKPENYGKKFYGPTTLKKRYWVLKKFNDS